ncbi:hypothetical protein [Enterococcus casseliflavus]|uniref:hypothetical protein n=1 Tax=Enterococcus casseliflavus TaxID=37734 RepID=UPI00232AE9B2|nr:hypothetical protein [Enterococcus casseliflavus]MDB1687487.1 hypothetical protein [Enterococcus casseliflavus]
MNAKKGVIEVFWTNVQWHMEKKNIKMSDLVNGKTTAAKNKTANIMLRRVQEIADILEIDDYAILFEEIEPTEANE